MQKINRDEAIDFVGRAKHFQSARSKLKSLRIEWCLDFAEMDFTKLESFDSIKAALDGHVGIVEMMKVPERHIGLDGLDGAHIDFIHFASSGAVVIPPIMTRVHEIKDDKEDLTPKEGLIDGAHRLDIAYLMGLEYIPIVVLSHNQYIFEYEKYDFEIQGNELIFTDKEIKENIAAFDISAKACQLYYNSNDIRVEIIRNQIKQAIE